MVTKAEFLFRIYLVHIPSHLVHTAANLQCTFEPPQGKPIPLLAYLQNSQQTLMVDCSSPLDEEDWLFIAVHMMKKTG